MKKPNTRVLVTIALAGGLMAAIPAFAHAYGGHRGCMPMNHVSMHGGIGDADGWTERMAHRLDLTKDQLTAVRAIVDRHRPELRTLRDQMADNHKQLSELKKQSAMDEGRLRTLADAQGKTIADLIVLRTEMRGEIDKVLTDKQREKLHHRHGRDGGWKSHDD